MGNFGKICPKIIQSYISESALSILLKFCIMMGKSDLQETFRKITWWGKWTIFVQCDPKLPLSQNQKSLIFIMMGHHRQTKIKDMESAKDLLVLEMGNFSPILVQS